MDKFIYAVKCPGNMIAQLLFMIQISIQRWPQIERTFGIFLYYFYQEIRKVAIKVIFLKPVYV